MPRNALERAAEPLEGEDEPYHEAQVPPLVQEIAVYVDAVRLAQILGDQGPDRGEVLLFERVLILDIPQLCGELCCLSLFPGFRICHSMRMMRTVSLREMDEMRCCKAWPEMGSFHM